MLIGQFTDSFFPVIDGVSMVTHHYARGLNKYMDHAGKSIVITADVPGYHDNHSDYDVIRYRSLPLVVKPPYRFALPHLDPLFVRQIQNIPFRLVHAHSPFGSGRLALGLARKLKIPLIATFHSKYYDDFTAVLKNESLARTALSNIIHFYGEADEIWTVNKASERTLHEYGYHGPVRIVPNGIDYLSGNDALTDTVCNVFMPNHADHDQPVLLYVGQLVWQKNLRFLCEALLILKQRLHVSPFTSFKMIFVGAGADEQAIRQLVHAYDLDHHVVFTGLINNRSQLHQLYQSADLLLFPSLYDTFSLVLREAAASYCPAVLLRHASIAEDITDGTNAFLSDHNTRIYADTILDALSDPIKRKHVGMMARRTLCCSWEDVIRQVHTAYCECRVKYERSARSAVS